MPGWAAGPYQETGASPWVQSPLWTLTHLCSPVQAALCLSPSSVCVPKALPQLHGHLCCALGCGGDDLLSLPDFMIFSNSNTSMPFPALRSPDGVTFLVLACFLAVVLVPGGQTHMPLLPLGALGCPELTAKRKYRSAVARRRRASLFAESNPGNASYRNVEQEKMVTSRAVC